MKKMFFCALKNVQKKGKIKNHRNSLKKKTNINKVNLIFIKYMKTKKKQLLFENITKV
jgi:hypothetical protein